MNLLEDPHRTPHDVKGWCEKVTKAGVCPEFPGWPKALFGLGKDAYFETIEYLVKRFRETEDMTEYYCCIPYLTQDITPNVLFVPWSMSPNFQRMQEGNTNVAPKNQPVMHGGKVVKLGAKVAKHAPTLEAFGGVKE
ncbi:MAG: hypothetical protein PWP14_1586 [Methanolobus sp.]|nr:hypothetical protein [Methanolobus sp.]